MNILVVDDEQAIADLVEVYLKNENYHVFKYYTGKEALDCIENVRLDLAILDVMLPDADGFLICQKIREKHNFPVIMLTAKDEETDKINGLTLGADDYITKPFRPLELLARVKAQLRRFTRYNSSEQNQAEHLITYSGFVLDMDNHICTLNEKSYLSPRQSFPSSGSFVPTAGGWSARKNYSVRFGETSISPITIIQLWFISGISEKKCTTAQSIRSISKRYGELVIRLKSRSGKRTSDYTKIKRKVFLKTLLIILAAIVTIFLLRFVIQKSFSFGDSMVRFLMHTFRLHEIDAVTIYRYIFLNNISLITFIVIMIFLVILLKFTISWFTKYFDEVSVGMDRLVEESDDDITLSPELDFMENKLNQIKSNLEKQKNAALDAEKRKNDLVVYLAHDIKTPLTSVIGYLNLLDEAPNMPAEQKVKYVGITLEKAYRLEQLINEFFEITRFNLQAIVLNKEKINMLLMLQQMADEFFPMLTPKGIRVSVNVPDGLILWGDADKLARVFNNILKNAIVYSYDNSVIDISAERQDKDIVITFTNLGNPIPHDKLATIFEKFYRLDSARSTNTGGAGLGLAIAQVIVTAHGGTITAESTTVNTAFTVKLPF